MPQPLAFPFSIATMWGVFTGEATERGIRRLAFPPYADGPCASHAADDAKQAAEALECPACIGEVIRTFQGELRGYLTGKLMQFTVQPDLPPGPAFHLRVWQALREVPYAQTVSYAQLAALAGSPTAARACGQACGANPVPLLVPCHRVLAAGGLGGFRLGADWKIRLLELEAR